MEIFEQVSLDLSRLDICLSATGVRQGELQKLIERHGGEVSRIVHKLVNLRPPLRRQWRKYRAAEGKGKGYPDGDAGVHPRLAEAWRST